MNRAVTLAKAIRKFVKIEFIIVCIALNFLSLSYSLATVQFPQLMRPNGAQYNPVRNMIVNILHLESEFEHNIFSGLAIRDGLFELHCQLAEFLNQNAHEEGAYFVKPIEKQCIGENIPNILGPLINVEYWREEDSEEVHKKSKIEIIDGIFYDSEGQLFDTSKATMTIHNGSMYVTHKADFIMDRFGQIYVNLHPRRGRYHHSTLAGGFPVASAGSLEVYDGRIVSVDHNSGHYKIPDYMFLQVQQELNKRGVANNSFVAKNFLECDRTLKGL